MFLRAGVHRAPDGWRRVNAVVRLAATRTREGRIADLSPADRLYALLWMAGEDATGELEAGLAAAEKRAERIAGSAS
jgi:hypothetical protein